MENTESKTISNTANTNSQVVNEENEPILTEDPILLSQFLALKVAVNDGIVKSFQDRATELATLEKKTKKQQTLLDDFIIHHDKLKVTHVNQSVLSEELINPSEQQQNVDTKSAGIIANIPAIKLNELVKKPEQFDGYKPPARKWIDDYENASNANGWSENQKVKYFSTFLDKSANDWYVTVGKRELGLTPNWQDLKTAFIRHYLGDSDIIVLRRQIERTFQGEKEKATNFIPRIIRLIELVEPNKPEVELVDLIRSKLRVIYQDKLTLCSTYTIEQLNDACLKIETSIEMRNPIAYKDRKEYNRNKEDKKDKNFDKKIDNKQNNRREGKTKEQQRSVKCYRCERTGHIAPNCRSTSKQNGEPCNQKPAAKDKPKRINNVNQDTNNPEIPKAEIVNRIRAAGTTSINTIQVCTIEKKCRI